MLISTQLWGRKKLIKGGTVVKSLPASAGDPRDVASILGWGRSPGDGNSNLLFLA